ncbi:uncharacterized protein LAESUDRAFT_401707 [Laetiporus sulphureus 93-53]|uniref:Uncharacterized protein n=1 Tax=Laetiporus sulphureus 93-53 TaxID=1314785 RepID=A0A165CBP6_9APHY|nr:uncharacterized protein LAESUDRAFT_401707 [Laetiporus sulphureus 93-53]KZT02519.1 hypothetical protein LAESUDRAFT_401707 [Laetiporus sulphureus 93-53]
MWATQRPLLMLQRTKAMPSASVALQRRPLPYCRRLQTERRATVSCLSSPTFRAEADAHSLSDAMQRIASVKRDGRKLTGFTFAYPALSHTETWAVSSFRGPSSLDGVNSASSRRGVGGSERSASA